MHRIIGRGREISGGSGDERLRMTGEEGKYKRKQAERMRAPEGW